MCSGGDTIVRRDTYFISANRANVRARRSILFPRTCSPTRVRKKVTTFATFLLIQKPKKKQLFSMDTRWELIFWRMRLGGFWTWKYLKTISGSNWRIQILNLPRRSILSQCQNFLRHIHFRVLNGRFWSDAIISSPCKRLLKWYPADYSAWEDFPSLGGGRRRGAGAGICGIVESHYVIWSTGYGVHVVGGVRWTKRTVDSARRALMGGLQRP